MSTPNVEAPRFFPDTSVGSTRHLLFPTALDEFIDSGMAEVENSGLSLDNFYFDIGVSIPIPLYPEDGSRPRWEHLNPQMLRSPLYWLPPWVAARKTVGVDSDGDDLVETDEDWAMRIAWLLNATGIYDPESGFIDMMAAFDVDLASPLTDIAVRSWLGGAAESTFDDITLDRWLTPASLHTAYAAMYETPENEELVTTECADNDIKLFDDYGVADRFQRWQSGNSADAGFDAADLSESTVALLTRRWSSPDATGMRVPMVSVTNNQPVLIGRTLAIMAMDSLGQIAFCHQQLDAGADKTNVVDSLGVWMKLGQCVFTRVSSEEGRPSGDEIFARAVQDVDDVEAGEDPAHLLTVTVPKVAGWLTALSEELEPCLTAYGDDIPEDSATEEPPAPARAWDETP